MSEPKISTAIAKQTKNKEKNFVSAVIYVREAEKKIADFLLAINSVLAENFEKYEIICVNDFSADASIATIKETSQKIKTECLSILNMSYFHGTELAMTAGVDLAIGDFVFEFDSVVLDFDKSEIMKVYWKALEGFDIVSAVPQKSRRLSSDLFYFVFNKFGGSSYKMTTERFRVLSRRVINRISSMNKTVSYRKSVYANCGLKTENITYNPIGEILEAEDKFIKSYRRNLAADTFIIFTDLGYKVSFFITQLMLLFTLGVGIYSLVYHYLKTPVAGWTSTILFLSVSMFFLFAVLTIILKYLQVLVNLVFRKIKYNFESIEKCEGGDEK